MSLETSLYSALKGLVANRVYRDVAPQKITTLPRITFQQVGGSSVNFIDGGVPSKKNARVQVNVWHRSRDEAVQLAREVEDTLRGVTALHTTVLGAPVAIYEEETELYGTMQDFSFWFTD